MKQMHGKSFAHEKQENGIWRCWSHIWLWMQICPTCCKTSTKRLDATWKPTLYYSLSLQLIETDVQIKEHLKAKWQFLSMRQSCMSVLCCWIYFKLCVCGCVCKWHVKACISLYMNIHVWVQILALPNHNPLFSERKRLWVIRSPTWWELSWQSSKIASTGINCIFEGY